MSDEQIAELQAWANAHQLTADGEVYENMQRLRQLLRRYRGAQREIAEVTESLPAFYRYIQGHVNE